MIIHIPDVHRSDVLQDLVKLRQWHADLLGYPNHAAYKQVPVSKLFYNLKCFAGGQDGKEP